MPDSFLDRIMMDTDGYRFIIRINTDPEKPAPPNFPYPRQPVESCCEAIVKLILNRDEECYTDPAWYYKVVDTVGSFGKP